MTSYIRMQNNTRISISIEDFSSTLTQIELLCIGVIMIFICIITIIGNALVLLSFILDKKLRTLSNYFLLSLAVSDIMIATFSMPLYIVYLLIGEWTLGPIICDMWLAQDYTCSNASCLNLLMIGFDRYFSVTNPLKYRVKRTGKRVGFMISCVWIISFLLWPPWIYAWPYIEGKRTVPDDDCYIQFLETNSYVTIITAVLDYYIPVLIMLVLYYKIWRETKKRSKYLSNMETAYQIESICLQKKVSSDEKCNRELPLKTPLATYAKCDSNQSYLKSADEADKVTEVALVRGATEDKEATIHESEINSDECDNSICDNVFIQKSSEFKTISEQNSLFSVENKKMSSTSKGNIKPDNKAARVLTAILLAFIITTTPYNILVIIKNLDTTHSIVPDSIWNFFYYLFYVNGTLNPLCYALANENFRKTYWQVLSCSWSKKSQYRFSNYSDKSSQSKNIYNESDVTSL